MNRFILLAVISSFDAGMLVGACIALACAGSVKLAFTCAILAGVFFVLTCVSMREAKK